MLVHLEGGNCTVTKEALNIMVAQSFYSRHVIVKEHRMALLSGKPRAKVIHFSRKEQKRQKDVETGGKKEDAEDGRSIGSREENDGGISLKMEALAITSPSEAIPGGKDGDSSPVKDTIPTSSMTRDVNLALFTIGSHPRPPPVLPATVHIVPPTPYTCSSCKKPFPTLPEAQQHVSSPAHDLLAFKCPDEKCTRRFKCLSGLVQHVEMKRCGDGMIIGGVIGKLLHYVHVTVSPLGRRGVGKLDGGVLV